MFKRVRESLAIYQGLPRDIYFIALSRFILGLGNFIMPFLVLLLTQKLGYSEAIASTVVMIVMCAFMVGGMLGGKLADSLGHKNMMVGGELLAGIILIICGFFANHHYIAPALIIITYVMVGTSVPGGNALAANLSTPKNRSAVMSMSYLAYNIGSGIGSLLAGYLFWFDSSIIYWCNGIAVIVGISLVAYYVREPKPHNDLTAQHQEHQEEDESASGLEEDMTGSVWQVLKARPQLIAFGLSCTLLYVSMTQMTVLSPLYVTHIFDKQGPELYGQLMTLACIAVVILTPILVKATHGHGELKGLMWCGSLLALGYVIMIASQWVPAFFVAFFVLAAAEVLLVTNENVYIANQSPRSHRGRISSVMNTLKNVGMVPAYVVMGLLVEGIGYTATWLCVVVISLISSAAFMWMAHKVHWGKIGEIPR